MTNEQSIEVARVVNLINGQLADIEFNMALHILTNILMVQIINQCPDKNTLDWIKTQCDYLGGSLYNSIEEIYKQKFMN